MTKSIIRNLFYDQICVISDQIPYTSDHLFRACDQLCHLSVEIYFGEDQLYANSDDISNRKSLPVADLF